MMENKFSVIMSVYAGDKAEYLNIALESVMQNTLLPAEVLLVVDGPVGVEIKSVIKKYRSQYSDFFRVVWLENNQGLGNARRVAVDEASYEYIAVMDADDICVSERFALQMKYLDKHPDISVLGGNIAEFVDNVDNIVGKRIVPTDNGDIYKWLKGRCPFNHMSVLFKKTDIEAAGGYLDWHYDEDYYLWIRMAEKGFKFANLSDVLVKVRVGEEMYQRRGGWKYFVSEYKLQKYMIVKNIISFPRFIWNVVLRFLLQVVFPNRMRGIVFRYFARN